MRRHYFIISLLSLFIFASCKNKNNGMTDPDTYYTCSMDPQVVESKPGTCPICKMHLTPVKKKKGAAADELELSDQQIQLGNITTDTIKHGLIGDQVVLTATLNFDQTKISSVSSRIMGRIEKLYYKNLGDYIKIGSPLVEVYSEELNNAKQEFLLALDRKKAFTSGTVIDFDRLIQSARNKLLLWGLTPEQIDDLAKTGKATPTTVFYSTAAGYITRLDIREGDYVMEGGTLVTIAEMSTLWAEAQLYSSQMTGLNSNSIATVLLPDLDNREIKGRIAFINPEINTATRINLIRVIVANPGNQLKPGMTAYVLLKSPERQTLSLPVDAVIRDGKSNTVWIQKANNTFKNTMVQTGLENNGRIEIRSGLKEGDVVVLTGAYLLHSEYIFKRGASPMAGHNH